MTITNMSYRFVAINYHKQANNKFDVTLSFIGVYLLETVQCTLDHAFTKTNRNAVQIAKVTY